jgi:hypothetical protein
MRAPVERIDGDVDLVPGPAVGLVLVREADLLTDVEHRRLVTLAFTDDNRAVDGHGVHLAAHGFDRDLVGAVAVALAHGVGAGNGGLFGDAKELEGEV